MSRPEAAPALRPLARQDGEPVFNEAWQAQTLGLAATLVEAGMFSAAQWSDSLGAALKQAAADGRPDDTETYYAAALNALETLLADGPVSGTELTARTAAWRRAYLNTPHGAPVELSNDPGET